MLTSVVSGSKERKGAERRTRGYSGEWVRARGGYLGGNTRSAILYNGNLSSSE
jgi:hypothetical protein